MEFGIKNKPSPDGHDGKVPRYKNDVGCNAAAGMLVKPPSLRHTDKTHDGYHKYNQVALLLVATS